jgi:hypothetical protein
MIILAVAIVACVAWVLAQVWVGDVGVEEAIDPPAQTEAPPP